MKKINKIALFLIIFLISPFIAKAITPTTIFNDSFEQPTGLGNWSEVGWNANSDGHNPSGKSASLVGANNDQIIEKNISTVGYENLNLSFWFKGNSLDIGDADKVELFYTTDGTIWTEITSAQIDSSNDDNEWHQFNFNSFPIEANNNPNFALKFDGSLNSGSDKVWIDELALTGPVISILECNANATHTIVSDGTTNVNIESSAVPTWTHPAWATISGASWIWSEASVSDPTLDHTDIFTKTFNISGVPTSANLEMASDNGYVIKLNNTEVVNKINEEASYNPTASYDVLSNVATGANTLEITVKNFAMAGGTAETNPAGLIYKLNINSDECQTPTEENEDPTPPVCNENEHLVENICILNETEEEEPEPEVKTEETKTSSPTPAQGGRRHDISSISGGGQGQVLGASTDGELMCELYLKEYIKFGAKNNPEEVKKLQIFLNQFFELNNPVTGFYGPITYDMVKKFQAHQEAGTLTPWTVAGAPTNGPTGYVYKTTQRWINILKCPEMIINTPLPSLP